MAEIEITVANTIAVHNPGNIGNRLDLLPPGPKRRRIIWPVPGQVFQVFLRTYVVRDNKGLSLQG